MSDSTMWQAPANRRRFFEEFAKQHKFDPLAPQEWYSQSVKNIMQVKVCEEVGGAARGEGGERGSKRR